MRTRFRLALRTNLQDIRPVVLTYESSDTLVTALHVALDKFKQVKRTSDVRFSIDSRLVQHWEDLAFADGTLVIAELGKHKLPDRVPVSAAPGTPCPIASITFLHKETSVDEEGIKQLQRTAGLPGMISCVGMPDLHCGSGAFPVGAAFVASRIIPELVGSDIGCGMSLFPLKHVSSELTDRQLQRLSKALGDKGFLPGSAAPTAASQHPLSLAHAASFGTIGAGNHFAELQVVEKLLVPGVLSLEHAYVLVHSGSRTFGEQVLRQYKTDQTLDAYMTGHDAATAWASDSRKAIGQQFADICSGDQTTVEPLLDITHNGVTVLASGNEGTTYLHRKGAAPTDAGLVAIPGSRGTFSYIVRPTNDEAILQYCGYSLAHGAGRAMSRGKVMSMLQNKYRRKDAVSALSRTVFNGYVVFDKAKVTPLFEESPEAYKDIETVIRDLETVGAIEVVAVLKPLITCKL